MSSLRRFRFMKVDRTPNRKTNGMMIRITPGDSSKASPNRVLAGTSPQAGFTDRLSSTKLLRMMTALNTISAPPTPVRVRAVT